MGESQPALGRIRQLDEAVANQIAAGEVVERPASVVKELVENALDAEATRVRVEVEEGGTRRIRITDDGIGMGPADARLCLSRHATSKIRGVEDLETVRTLGFRGEAVPSIASVSRFVLTTCERGADLGTRIVVEGGQIIEESEVGAPPGTTIEVADLFFNVPARKKFLKRAQTELSHISEGLMRLAMCRPEVGLRLATEHKTLLDVPPGVHSDPRGRLGRLLGPQIAAKLHPIVQDGLSHAVQVTGFAAEPGLSERGTQRLYTFVNGRFVRDRTIQHAVQDAYRTLLERGRYPVVVLFLELDPGLFDVNVHPQKTEVRFAQTGDIHRAVAGALSRTLSAQPWLRADAQGVREPPPARTYQLRRAPAPGSDTPAPSAHDRGPASYTPPQASHDRTGPSMAPAARTYAPPPAPSSDGFSEHAARAMRARNLNRGVGGLGGGAASYVPRQDLSAALGRASSPAEAPEPTLKQQDSQLSMQAQWSGRFSELQPIGQVLGTYLVCQGPGRMVIIDQHAAHERVTFQTLRTQGRSGDLPVQPLLVPLVLHLDPARQAAAHDLQDELLKVGLHIEPVNDSTWQVRACPLALKDAKLETLVLDLLDELRELPEATSVQERLDALFSCAACHSSVRAKDRLHNDEIRALLQQMDAIDFGAFCPHGRPVFVQFSEGELAKLFHRS